MYPPASGAQSARARRQPLAVFLVAILLLHVFPLSRPALAVTNGGGISAFDTPLTENFDGLASSGTPAWVDNSTIPGWYSSRTAYTPGTGSSNAGALYSFGVAGTNPVGDRALGSVASGTTGTIAQGVRLKNNTGATITSLDISYVGEQWRNGGNTATQKLQFQYQVANAGVITGINAGTWTAFTTLDFSSLINTATAAALDGNAAANRALKSATLTVTVNNGQEVWLRWIDVDDSGTDHGLAIDDFSVTAHGAGATNPSGVGSASPSSVTAGGTTLLTVAVTGGTSPVSTGLGVTANLSTIGGSAAQQFYDDGTHGDVTAGDNTFSFSATVANATSGGAKSLPFTVTDAQSRSGSGNIALTVLTPTNPSGTGTATPGTVQAGGSTLLTVAVTPGANPTSTGLTVTGDLSTIGGSATQQFYDDGTHGDVTANNNTFSYSATVPVATASGIKTLPVQIADAQARTASTSISLSVQSAPTPAGAVVISQIYGAGGNNGAFYRYDFIELFNRSSQPVNLNGWSVQYASAGGGATAAWNRSTPLTGVIQPGQYFFVREASGANTAAADYPVAPDITGTIAMGATDGKVALVNSTADLPAGCPIGNPNVIDFVGYGTADCYEGTTAAPTMSVSSADIRTHNGCKDTDLNNLNFTSGPPSPRNSGSTLNVCPAGDLAPDVYSTDPANGGTNTPLAANVTVNFDANVNVSDGGFTLSCSLSGPHTLTVTGGPSTFTLNPDTDFASGETCTATVLASHVTAQSGGTPMAADYTWTFGTLIARDPAEHLVMGNPSGATADVNTPNNYLLTKPQYATSYNNDKGTPNWTSWHLDSSWTTGVSDRQNDFRSDDTLPPSFKHVTSGYNFATYGFDRGHMTPSADRTSSVADNSATFLMTNMVPQASGNNQGPWASMENDLRSLLNGSSNELYIISGGQGTGGNSTTGHWDTIQDTGGNTVNVPAFTWKVVMVLSRQDGDDVARVNNGTRTFAVIMPNNDNIRPDDWRKYIATVDQVEALTGYNFFSNVPESIQNVIEARLDDTLDTTPVANSQTVSTAEDTQKAITLSASDFNVNNVFTYVIGAPSHGQLSGTAPNLTYTPDANYNGPDAFTFKVNDGARDSNVATVTINVTAVNDAPVANDDSATTDEDTPVTVSVLANDSDVEGDTLSLSAVTQGAHGIVAIVGSDVKYTPAANYNGSDSFTYTVSDGHGGTAVGNVNVTVNGTNDNPVANDDAATTDEDTAVSVNVVANDTDVDNDTLTVSAVTQGAHGSVSFAGGSVTYTPAPNYNGGDSFSYTIGDGHGGSATANVSVTVNAVNDGPSAANDSATVAEDSGANTISVLGNDSDIDGDTLSVSAVTQGANGSVANNGSSVSYTPNANYNGPDSFSYTVSDGHGGTATATVSVTVTAVNDNPVATNDTATTDEDTAVTVNVVGNDSDIDGDTLSLESVGGATHGSVAVVGGQAVFTPDANYNGPASFNYVVSDNHGGTAQGSVSVTVNPVNDNPTAGNDSATTNEDTAVTVSVLGNDTDVDGDTLSVSAVTQGAHGSVTNNGGSVSYTPNPNYNGGDSFTYDVSDGHGGTATATVNVTVTAVNDNPTANADSATTDEDTPVTVGVLANDSDVDGDTLSIASVTQGAHGAVTFSGGDVTYTPALNYNGGDSFTYTVSDGQGGTATAAVSVTVSAVNDRPVANNDSATVAEDSTNNVIEVLTGAGADTDVDGDVLSVASVGAASNGTAVLDGGLVKYTPNGNYNGSDSFSYTVSDGHGGTATATVSVTVTAVNDNPTTTNDTTTTDEDTPVTVDVVSNDSDVDGDTVSLESVDGATHGSVAVVNGKAVFTPAANYNGPASFNYVVNDGHGGTAQGSVSVTVNPVNDNPVANADSATTDEDTAVTKNVLANDSDVDGDSLSIASVTQGAHGSVTFSGGDVTYTPNANYNGGDSFTYTINDGNGGGATATVSITVRAVNDNPVAGNDSATTDEDTAVGIAVLTNDTDADNDTLSVTGAGGASKGTVTFTASGVTYTPNANANGTDSFTYTVSDGHGGTATGTVNVTINAVNDAPSSPSTPGSVTIPELAAYTFTATASDVDGDALTFSLVGAPAGATISPSGVFNWTPTEAQGGTGTPYTFTVRVSDGTSNADSSVSITVTEVNSAPTLAPIASQTVNAGSTLTFTAAGADADLPAQTLGYSLTGTVPSGASINPASGVFNWTPTAAQAGQSYTFNVRVSDGTSNAAQPVTVNVVSAVYSWSGFLQPINPNGSSVFKAGQTVPVKFQLTGASAGITNAVARLYLAKVSNNVVGSEEAAGSTSNATEGNLFRYSDGQYIFNLSTKGLTAGTYQLRVDLGDGVQRTVLISLR